MQPDRLPGWPRSLTVDLAAAYVGISKSTFLKGVREGRYPRPYREGRRVLWDRLVLDGAVDQLAGAKPDNDNARDGAHLWMDRINGTAQHTLRSGRQRAGR